MLQVSNSVKLHKVCHYLRVAAEVDIHALYIHIRMQLLDLHRQHHLMVQRHFMIQQKQQKYAPVGAAGRIVAVSLIFQRMHL